MLLLVQMPVAGASSAIGKVVPRTGESAVNGVPLKLETTVFAGDAVSTTGQGSALMLLSKGDRVILGPETTTSVISSDEGVTIDLSDGMVRTHANNKGSVAVRANGLVVRPVAGKGSFEVGIDGEAILVSAVDGDVEVFGISKSAVVPMNKAMRFETAATPNVSAVMQGSGAGPMKELGLWIIIGAGVLAFVAIDQIKDDCVPTVSPANPCP
jgi:hypothetical protein